MAEFTKEQLIAEVHYNLEHCFCSEKTKRLMEIALSALEAEPVATFYKSECGNVFNTLDSWLPVDGVNKLYAAPQLPQTAVVDERAAFNAWNNEDNLPIVGVGAKNAAWLAWQARATLCGNSVLDVPPERPADSSSGDDVEAWFDEGWNACRAAMLQGKAETVSQRLGGPGGVHAKNEPHKLIGAGDIPYGGAGDDLTSRGKGAGK